jgi:NAD-dependent deacetylase
MRRAALGAARPNAAHAALARLERELDARGVAYTLITQNVDGLHAAAGSRALEMHGSLRRLRCERCGARVADESSLDPACFVACGACGHERLRPDVVWFEELPLYLDEIDAALRACTHFWALGTSGVVYPAAGLLAAARARGARTLVQALEPPENAALADELVLGRAAERVPELVERTLREL